MVKMVLITIDREGLKMFFMPKASFFYNSFTEILTGEVNYAPYCI